MEERRQKFKVLLCAVAAGSFVGGWPDVATAAPIDDRSFFDAIPHTFLDFETKGDGSPVNVSEGGLEFMDFNEYNAFGMRWNVLGNHFWGNPSDPDDEAAIAAAGSPNHVVGWSSGTAGIIFTASQMQSIGFSLFVDTSVNVDPIRFDAFRADGSIIETFEFDASRFDDTIGDIAFGFVGLTLDEPMSGIVFFQTLSFAIDDLHYSTVPAPGGPAMAALVIGAALRRRVR